MSKKEFEFYTKGEIKNLLLSNEKLVYVDNGIDEIVVKYSDLPDVIVDMCERMEHKCNLKVYKYSAKSTTPILTTVGWFLDKCDLDVRADIIDRLILVQTEIETKNYKIIDEYSLEIARDEIESNMSVNILNVWLSDFGDIRCNATISVNGKERANIIVSFDINNFSDWENSQNKYKEEIIDRWEDYLHLPKISKCSKLLQEIYDNVCESDASMCHITEDDWKNYYADRFTDKDFRKLKNEVKKYKLKDVITFDNHNEYKIVGWGNLETSFNDDRNLAKNKDLER